MCIQIVCYSLSWESQVLKLTPQNRAAIKCAPPGKEYARWDLIREYEAYCVDKIASNHYFREFYDVVGDPKGFDDETHDATPRLALEWMNTTFADVLLKPDIRSHVLIKHIIHTLMLSYICLGQAKIINTSTTLHFVSMLPLLTKSDTKPANILLSGIDTDHLVIKVADLGSSE